MSQSQTLQKTVPASERFSLAIVKEFSAATGGAIELSPRQKVLAKHLFIKIDADLQKAEMERIEKGKNFAPYVWSNVNMTKLAIDAMHRVQVGLDAMVPNHLHTIPYFNGKSKKYDLDLRIGYGGKDYYRRMVAMDPPRNITYELVHENDKFKPIKKSVKNPVEGYEFEMPKPFDRGKVIGGFGYIEFEDQTKNRLVIVTMDDFEKSRLAAKNNKFWQEHQTSMQFKTVVHRTTDTLTIDPEKVSESYLAIESQESETELQNLGDRDAIDVTAFEVSESSAVDERVAKFDELTNGVSDANSLQEFLRFSLVELKVDSIDDVKILAINDFARFSSQYKAWEKKRSAAPSKTFSHFQNLIDQAKDKKYLESLIDEIDREKSKMSDSELDMPNKMISSALEEK